MDSRGLVDPLLDDYIHYICAEFKAFPSGGNNTSNKQPRYNFEQLTQRVFGDVAYSEIPSLFLRILDYLPVYMTNNNSCTHVFSLNNVWKSISLPQLVAQTILQYFMPRVVVREHKEELTPNNKKKRPRSQTLPCPVVLSEVICQEFLRKLLPFDFPIESKLWKCVAFVLQIRRNVPAFAPIFTEAIHSGNASFSAIAFCMHEPQISQFLDRPDTILQAVYCGPLRATTVESFVANRSKEFREACRQLLLMCERAAYDMKEYHELRPIVAWNVPIIPWTFEKFAENTKQLMKEMRGEPTDTLIHTGWAVAAVRKFARRYYVEKTWRLENLQELIWTVLVQRPHLKTVVCNILSHEFHDQAAASSWWRFNSCDAHRSRIHSVIGMVLISTMTPFQTYYYARVTPADPLEETDEFINFPQSVRGVEFVFKESQLLAVSELIASFVKKDGRVMVSLDAEWSAYISHSRATILQLALIDQIFIVDLESIQLPSSALRVFFEKLFMNDKILKIGFQFHEDLSQLRAAVNQCPPLFHPVNLICIGKLVAQLIDETSQRENSADILEKVVPRMKNGLQADSSAESLVDGSQESVGQKEGDSVAASEPEFIEVEGEGQPRLKLNKREHQVLSKGLSALCEYMLGRPLDKTEQCSVWDRRPLRPLQLRYAAMDAYCLLMLHDKCVEWASELGMSIEELQSRQGQIRVCLPLFSGDD